MSYCMDCGAKEGAAHDHNCAIHERSLIPSMKEINDALGAPEMGLNVDAEHDAYAVTTLTVAVHSAGTSWLGSDNTVVVEVKDKGGGPWLELASWDGPAVIDSLAMLEAVTDTARRLLAESEVREGEA